MNLKSIYTKEDMKKTITASTLLFILTLIIGMTACGSGKAKTPGPITPAREVALQTDLRLVKEAVDAFFAFSGLVPTIDRKLPPAGRYSFIDFNASYKEGEKTILLYPDFLLELPEHHDEGVWLIDSLLNVSVDIEPSAY